MSGEIGRRVDDRHTKVGADANRDHPLPPLAETNVGGVALRDDVRQAIVDVEFELDVGIARQNASLAVSRR
ncbi:MAG TPA: hypothetical protein VHS33_04310 [Sphingomicrobium sp.]|nr:hypothetical protein [Sphingomicrobium sp.]